MRLQSTRLALIANVATFEVAEVEDFGLILLLLIEEFFQLLDQGLLSLDLVLQSLDLRF